MTLLSAPATMKEAMSKTRAFSLQPHLYLSVYSMYDESNEEDDKNLFIYERPR
jgi:hypothetical protein